MNVQFTETVLRDANQSLIATRLPYEKFEPILETMDKAGFYSAECWGGATFDVCLRYLNEDPWERLRKIRAKMPNTKLQMLLRGQNILGYKHYPDDIVRRFVRTSVRNGIDIIRIFDALNDIDNLRVAIEATVEAGAMASGTISYTTSPVHTLDSYVKLAKEMAQMGVGSICIKDMAGILTPKAAYDLVAALKDAVDLPVVMHTHSTTGMAFMAYLKGIEAGADVIDTAISPAARPSPRPRRFTAHSRNWVTALTSTRSSCTRSPTTSSLSAPSISLTARSTPSRWAPTHSVSTIRYRAACSRTFSASSR